MQTISVVVPCFNAAPYLAEALESIFAQGVTGLEVIVVDDGSADDSTGVAALFGDRLLCVRQENQGINGARNTGLREATGNLIAFLDADDIWPTNSLRTRVSALISDATIGCVYGAVEQFISPDVSEEDRASIFCPAVSRAGRLAGAMLITRQAFETVGFFDRAYGVGETMDWVARAEDAGIRSVSLDSIVLRRRIHSTNSVRQQVVQQRDYLRVLKATMERRRHTENQEL